MALLNLKFDADRTLHEFHTFKDVMLVKGAEFYDLELCSSYLYFTIEFDDENEKLIMDFIKQTKGVSLDE